MKNNSRTTILYKRGITMKRISILFIIIALMIGVSGCMNNSFDVKNTSSNELVDYMNEKYDDKFSYKAPFGGGAGATTKQILVTSKKYPDYDIWVEYSYENESFNDNYIDYKYKTRLEEYLIERIENTFKTDANVKCEVSTSGSYVVFNADITFDEYLNEINQKNAFSAVVKNVDIDNKKKIEEQLEEIFTENKSGFFGTIYFVEDEVNIESFLEKNVYEKGIYPNVKIKKFDEGAIRFEWR